MNDYNLLKDNEIINLITRNENYLNYPVIVDRIFKLNMNNFILFFKNVSNVSKILSQKDKILQLPSNYFNILYLNLNNELKKQMILDDDYLKKIVKSEKNRLNKDLFDLSDVDIKKLILSREKQLNIIDENLFQNYTSRLKLEEIAFLETKIENNNIDEKLFKLKNKFNIDDSLYNSLLIKLNNNELSIITLYKLKNIEEIFIYNNYNIILDIVKNDNETFFIGSENLISKSILYNVNKKHMKKIILKLLEISNNKIDNNKIFITAVKLYSIFGFDDTMKILNNKFTFMNNNSSKTVALNMFVKERREYRIENQNKFYSNEMLKNTIRALETKNLYYFCNICFKSSNEDKTKSYDNYLIEYMENMIEKTSECNTKKEKEEIVSEIVKNTIKERELNIQKKFINNNQKKIEKNSRKNGVDYNELYELFKGIDVNKFILDKDGRFNNDKTLCNLLLGNKKHDNDCLLRLIFNKKAFGIERNLSYLINNFSLIKEIASDNSNSFSINSILDVLDICKASMYQLQPNEKELTLDTITKIQNSYQYCNESQDEIFRRTRKLYQNSKRKVESSIPIINGITKDNIKYEIIKPGDQSLLTVGIDTGNCLRVGGKGEDFLEYCMTSPHGAIIGIRDQNDKFYICPIIRNGNGIYCNGIDPKPENEEESKIILETLKTCVKRIISTSFENQKIEFATVTDLHQQEFFSKQNMKTLEITDYLPINGVFYSDYNKEELKNYIISDDNDISVKKYVPETVYYVKRTPNYIYEEGNKENKENIEELINSIAYESIDSLKNISSSERNTKKRNFKQMNIEDYKYVIGNKDWYILIDNSFKLSFKILPYDIRAKIDFTTVYNAIKQQIGGMLENGNKGKSY